MTEKIAKISIDEKGRSFEARIAEAFNGKPLTKVAELLGLNYHTFRNYAQQRTDIPPDVLLAIAKSANVTVDWLLTGEEVGQVSNLSHKSNVIPLPHRIEFSETEWELISEAAEVAGKSPDEWVKDTLNDVYGTTQAGHLIPRARNYFDALDELVGEMVERRMKRG